MGEELTELEDAIKEAEKQLSEMKREYKEKGTAS